MIKYRQLLSCLVLLLVVLLPAADIASALPPLSAGTFPAGTIIVPMDGKQGDRVHVYGFIHEFLRLVPGAGLARVIEPPDVTLQTALTPSGDVYQGGPFLIEAKFLSDAKSLLATKDFSKVTYTTLTTSFTTNKIFFVRQPTRILVIYGVFGRTDLTLSRMGINYTLVDQSVVENNPSLLNQYSLIVVDCPGWFGNPGTYTTTRRTKIQAVYDTIQARVRAGNEVIYTDIALKDLNATFPGYVNLAPGAPGSWVGTVYNPPKGAGSPPEFPSQYYNAPPNPNTVKLFTEGGGWVVSSVTSQHTSDVRVLIDTDKFGVPFRHAILGFYFQFGNGIVEGLALHPYEQLYPNYSDLNGYYATYEIYGNKFVHGPQTDFIVSATPPAVTVPQGQVASYAVTVTSIGSFASTVNLQVSGLPAGASASFSPSSSVTPGSGASLTLALNIQTQYPTTPVGSYNITITGSSTLPLITRGTSVVLNVSPVPSDFAITANPKAPDRLIVNPGQCGNITVSVTSIGNFSSTVNLTLLNRPGHVASQYLPILITPPKGGTVVSILRVCPDSSASPGNYTMTVVGTGGGLTRTVDVVLSVPKSALLFNPLIFLLVLLLLFLALGLGLTAIALSGKRGRGPLRSRAQYVLPLPTIRCRYCGRIMQMHAVYCPFCGRPQVILTRRPPPRVVTPGRRVSGKGVMGFSLSLTAGLLVLLNSAALLVPSFYATWAGIFWWLPSLGPVYAFALGMIIGLTLILGSIIMVLGHGALADVIIFPFAVFSLILGGGFVAGMVLGVVGGIIGALRR